MTEPSAARAPLIEVFRSIQGEGRHVGRSMRFVRTATCPLRCRYCDTPHSYRAQPTFVVHGAAGPLSERNPASAQRVAELLRDRFPDADPSEPISLTGGEPLVHPRFVLELARAMAPAAIHLETAAMHPDALATVLDAIDHLSADYKLPSTLSAGDHDAFPTDVRAQHVACVHLASTRAPRPPTIDVKVVVTATVEAAELAEMRRDLLPYRHALRLVLQPVSPAFVDGRAVDGAVLQREHDQARRAGFDVMVLPQVHRSLHMP